MSADPAFLVLLLDGPLQSWGFASRFQRRTTGLHPTKSAVVGLLCAAMGLAKGSPEETEWLPKLAELKMTSIALPRNDILRLEDFHTTGGGYDKRTQPQFIPRKASGGPSDNPTVSRRQFLLDARFGIILQGDRALLDRAAAALQDPVWGVWLGRKSCIPSAPLLVGPGLCPSQDAAWRALLRACKLDEASPMEQFTTVTEVEALNDGNDSWNDQPVSFGDGTSSAPDKRRFATRRIKLVPARTENRRPQT